ncbi:MAG: hypothetical protein U5R48_14690 [Gammaproteobacteria bacterium]|nr:hypothetical protein [Gammaproteobacteria bacterium]
MAATERTRAAARLRELLEENRTLQKAEDADPQFTERLRKLQAWQSQRLLGTHADLAADPRFGPGVRFFVDDLYAPKDFSGRDADIERAYPYMVKALPRAVLDTAADAARLYVLSRRLDRDMVTALFETLGVHEVHAHAYAEAYRICDAREDRLEQIRIIEDLARRLDRYVRSPLVLGVLRMARGPARMAGLSELQDFLERGASAFHHIGGARSFVDIISERERIILDRMLEGHPEPFDLSR